ncbi:MAG: hypothetical protein WBO43_02210, partial [Gemmatimonadota bacterium]
MDQAFRISRQQGVVDNLQRELRRTLKGSGRTKVLERLSEAQQALLAAKRTPPKDRGFSPPITVAAENAKAAKGLSSAAKREAKAAKKAQEALLKKQVHSLMVQKFVQQLEALGLPSDTDSEYVTSDSDGETPEITINPTPGSPIAHSLSVMEPLSSDAATDTPLYDIPFAHTLLAEDRPPKRPEDFLGSVEGPSNRRAVGFPLRATQDCVVPGRTQCTVPVSFEENAVRPACDYVVELPDKQVAQAGIRTAKALVDGSKQKTQIALINACLHTARVSAGSIVGWAFPLEETDEVLPCLNDKGKQDHMPLRPRSHRLQKQAAARSGKNNVVDIAAVHSIAIEDPEFVEDDFLPPRMSS